MERDLPPQQVPQLTDLAAAIHRAAAAATALSTPSPSSHAGAAVAALRDAHAAIGSFLSRLDAAAALSCDDQPMAEGGQEPEEDGDGGGGAHGRGSGGGAPGLRPAGEQEAEAARAAVVAPRTPQERRLRGRRGRRRAGAGRRGAAARGHGSTATVPCLMRRR